MVEMADALEGAGGPWLIRTADPSLRIGGCRTIARVHGLKGEPAHCFVLQATVCEFWVF